MDPEPSARAHVSRRALIIGGASVVVLAGAAALGVEENILPGRSTLSRVLGLDGPAGTIPNVTAGPMTTGEFTSAARLGKSCGFAISYPPDAAPGDRMPVLIALHGFGGSHRAAFYNGIGLDRFLAQTITGGAAPFAIASVDGGNSYWHKRASGEDSGAMVTNEFIPLLADHGLDVANVGFLGWSMGGFGALHLGAALGASRTAVVVAESPALWSSAGRAAKGAFDNAADFVANTPVGRQNELDGIPVLIDCGTGDGFYPEAKVYAAGFTKHPAGGFVAGGHNDSYWRRMAPAQLAFAAKHLA
ncbi:MAG TPA: alpha/beta hydrolase-fold protein [Galbitalea sp.]|jgi:S-formylglutathione hydrolase FrmB